MLIDRTDFSLIAEVNPPQLPDMSHLSLNGAWGCVVVTDNVFGKIRVSPYAYAARITHDVPSVHPTVVVSTRDRNILAIESEVRGALGNGVDSFLVVIGDTMPAVDHQAHHLEIVEHLRQLQSQMPPFEVGMPTRFREWQFRRRIDHGAQFFVAGPVVDPATLEEQAQRLNRKDGDPPVYLMVMPPFTPNWIAKAVSLGAVPATAELLAEVERLDREERRAFAWRQVSEIRKRAEDIGFGGMIVVGLKYETLLTAAQHLNGQATRHRGEE